MRIVENGDPQMQRTEKEFRCRRCGCAFTAEAHEYQLVHIGQAVFFRAGCPWCGIMLTTDGSGAVCCCEWDKAGRTTPESAVRRDAVKR